jgi:hemoglobin-like flavoprotein
MARQRETQKRPVAVRALLDAVLQILAYGMRSSGVAIEQDLAPGLPLVSCDADQMQQVLSNLLVNAHQALEAQPQPRRVRLSAPADAEWVQIEVADNGPGVPEQIRARVFDPFFTTKPIGAGTGIGLGVSRGIVEAHGGSLALAPSRNRGACFVVRLPLRQDLVPAVAEAPGAATDAPARGERAALIVDDEAEVGRLLSEMLAAQGFRCDVVMSGEAAQALLLRRDYDAILCDVRMPDIDGPAPFAWISEHRPHLCARTAFVTGDTLGAAAGGFLTRSGRPSLEKPFVPADARIAPQAERIGLAFYDRLFALDISLRTLFPSDLRPQVAHLMAALAMVVGSLDDLAPVLAQVQALGRRHASYGVEPRNFATVGTALLATLEAELGEAFTEAARAAWSSAYGTLSDAVIAAMSEATRKVMPAAA